MSYYVYMKSIVRALTLALLILSPSFALAQVVQTQNTGYSVGIVSNSGGFNAMGQIGFSPRSCTGGIACVAGMILYIINAILVPLLFAISFIVFLYGIAKTYIFSHGEQAEVEKGHTVILWGIIGFVVMVSVWGLVNVVSNTFGLSGQVAPTLPRSQ